MPELYQPTDSKLKTISAILSSLALIFILGYLDFKTGYELSFFIFYIFPLALASWVVGRGFGFFIAFVCFVIWFLADRASGHTYSEEWIVIWNGCTRLVFFTVSSFMISELKYRFDIEKRAARMDPLTGALNGRAWHEKLGELLDVSERTKSSFALAVIDLDNFKKVNDTHGHAKGDEILQRVVAGMKANLRKVDLVGRLGGDEFAIFLPFTDALGAEKILRLLRASLLVEVKQENWPIGFSIGAVTVDATDGKIPDPKDITAQADKLMYWIKKEGGKNDLLVKKYQQGGGVVPLRKV